MHSRVERGGGGAPRQQQFSTACEWASRAICWPKSLIISTSLSVGDGAWGASGVSREEIKGGKKGWHQMRSCWHWEVRRRWEGKGGCLHVQRTCKQICSEDIHHRIHQPLFVHQQELFERQKAEFISQMFPVSLGYCWSFNSQNLMADIQIHCDSSLKLTFPACIFQRVQKEQGQQSSGVRARLFLEVPGILRVLKLAFNPSSDDGGGVERSRAATEHRAWSETNFWNKGSAPAGFSSAFHSPTCRTHQHSTCALQTMWPS